MVIENEIPQFAEWIGQAVVLWLRALGIVAATATILAWIFGTVRRGPMAAAQNVYDVMATGVIDIARTSPRRVMALAILAFQEAIRRRVLVAFLIFVALLLFAVWFLDRTSQEPAKLYLGFV